MGARHSVARCPRWWSGAKDRSERIRQCVSEDRRSWAARWGAWAPKVRLHFGIAHLGLGPPHTLVGLIAVHALDGPLAVLQHRVANPGGLVARRTDQQHVAVVQRSLEVDDPALHHPIAA